MSPLNPGNSTTLSLVVRRHLTSMRTFQVAARRAIERALAHAGVTIYWNQHPTGEVAAMDYGESDVDVSGAFDLHGRRHAVWIYPNDLELRSAGANALFEHQDFEGDERKHIEAFCAHLRDVLGTN